MISVETDIFSVCCFGEVEVVVKECGWFEEGTRGKRASDELVEGELEWRSEYTGETQVCQPAALKLG